MRERALRIVNARFSRASVVPCGDTPPLEEFRQDLRHAAAPIGGVHRMDASGKMHCPRSSLPRRERRRPSAVHPPGDPRRWFPMQSKLRLDALHHRPVFMAAMSYVRAIVTPRIAAPCAQAVAIATIITTTGTIRAGVRTRVQD